MLLGVYKDRKGFIEHYNVKRCGGKVTVWLKSGIVERYVSNVFYSERIVRVFYSQSDKILGVFYPK